MNSLRSIERRIKKLERRFPGVPLFPDINTMSDEELELKSLEVLQQIVGSLDAFRTLEALLESYRAGGGRVDDSIRSSLQPLLERAHWFQHHADHGPCQFGPRWTLKPLLSCNCGGHLSVYRSLIPAEFWHRITEDDEPRTACY